MAGFTHTLGATYRTDAGTISSTTSTFTGDAEIDLDSVVPLSTTNKEFDIQFTKTDVVSMIMFSDKAVTLKTNSSGSPSDTISLAANMPLVWHTDSPTAIPIVGNVTKIFVTNSGSTNAAIKIRVLAAIGV
jgi:hypothetical protein